MRIYTKTGDQGETSLNGGTRVPKDHLRIEAYGTVDELNSQIGLVRDLATDQRSAEVLESIQNKLFNLGSKLSTDPEKSSAITLELNENDIDLLEQEMDHMDKSLPKLQAFILPGGHSTVSHCHIARSVCRRAERRMIALSRQSAVDPLLIKYINRLSDYLFVLARKMALDLGVDEVKWKQ